MIHSFFALFKDKLLGPVSGHPTAVLVAVAVMAVVFLAALASLFLD